MGKEKSGRNEIDKQEGGSAVPVRGSVPCMARKRRMHACAREPLDAPWRESLLPSLLRECVAWLCVLLPDRNWFPFTFLLFFSFFFLIWNLGQPGRRLDRSKAQAPAAWHATSVQCCATDL